MQKCVFCPIVQNFLLVGPYFQHIIFLATMATTYHLGAEASLKFLAIENMPPHFSALVYYVQMAGWIRIPLGTETLC